MKQYIAAVLGVVAALGVTPTQHFAKAPAVFLDRGACPGECCTYGKWRAKRTTKLYEAPTRGARVVGQVEAGTYVEALTGQVHTRAGRFVVRNATPPYKVGEVIWVYTYLGEGYYKIWRAGEIVSEEISVTPDQQNQNDWGYYERAPESLWWINVRKENGLEGWTDRSINFSGTHSCG